MLAVCIESSHQRGMGHLFRSLNLIAIWEKTGEKALLLMNKDDSSVEIVKKTGISYLIVDLWDEKSDWEGKLIESQGITLWLNDRLDTGRRTAEHVKKRGIPLFTIDDMGEGAALCDGNFASLIFEGREKIPGKRVYAGHKYLVLNPEIERYKRERTRIATILVTLGGSDTYGVTPEVVRRLRQIKKSISGGRDIKVTVLLGPGTIPAVRGEVEREIEKDGEFECISCVPSLIEMLCRYDLAVTGGGVTCFEANASGLPCIIIANEPHEIQIGRYMEQNGSSWFAGYYQNMDIDVLPDSEQIRKMSRRGLDTITLQGAENICRIIREARDRREDR